MMMIISFSTSLVALPSASRNLISKRNRKITTPTHRRFSSSVNRTVVVASAKDSHHGGPNSASELVRRFYAGINGHDLSSVEELIADDCVYEDLVFPRPFVGRKAILDFFNKFTDSTSTDLQFVIDDISLEDSTAVGVTWHLEWKGRTFPFSKGCSFYRLQAADGKPQIVYGRDCVEPAIKPGDAILSVLLAGCYKGSNMDTAAISSIGRPALTRKGNKCIICATPQWQDTCLSCGGDTIKMTFAQ